MSDDYLFSCPADDTSKKKFLLKNHHYSYQTEEENRLMPIRRDPSVGTLGAASASGCTWMYRISMSISIDSPSDKTLNQGPLVLILWQQYEFPSGINIV